MQSKKLNQELLDKVEMVSPGARSLFLGFYLKADHAGVIPFEYSKHLKELIQHKLLRATSRLIVIENFLSYNYGQLIETYNPHSKAWGSISATGYAHDSEQNCIDIPDSELIGIDEIDSMDFFKLESSSKNALSDKFVQRHETRQESASKSILEPRNKIISFLSSPSFALVLVGLLLIIQSICSSKAILNLTSLTRPFSLIYSIGGAMLLDLLLLYFVALGRKLASGIMLVFCSVVNVYSFHLNEELIYMTFASFVAILISITVPVMIHMVSYELES